MRNFHREFIAVFNKITPHYRRSEVFRDFVTMYGLELYLATYQQNAEEDLVQQLKNLASRYTREEMAELGRLGALTVGALEYKPTDFLGEVFMQLELGDEFKAQYFTPMSVASVMAAMTLVDCEKPIKQQGFITIEEPTCGSGVMIIATYNHLQSLGFNPQQQLWVRARDLDFTAAMMCYVQMTLLNIPGEIIIGNSLTNSVQYRFYTLSHRLFGWNSKLKAREALAEAEVIIKAETDLMIPNTKTANDPVLDIDWENEVIFY